MSSFLFSAIQYLKEKVPDVAAKKVLLIGTGKIGANTCRNLIDYLGCRQITLINRTHEKAVELATELGITAVSSDHLNSAIPDSDIIIVAANANDYLITAGHLDNSGQKWIVDLSIPNNVHPEVGNIPGKQLLNVDELSRIKDETLQKKAGRSTKGPGDYRRAVPGIPRMVPDA